MSDTGLPLGLQLGQYKNEVDGTIIGFHGLVYDNFMWSCCHAIKMFAFRVSAKAYNVEFIPNKKKSPPTENENITLEVKNITRMRGFTLSSEASLTCLPAGYFKQMVEDFRNEKFRSTIIPQFRFDASKFRTLQAQIISKTLCNNTFNKRAIIKHCENADEDSGIKSKFKLVNFTLPFGFDISMQEYYRKKDLLLQQEQYNCNLTT